MEFPNFPSTCSGIPGDSAPFEPAIVVASSERTKALAVALVEQLRLRVHHLWSRGRVTASNLWWF